MRVFLYFLCCAAVLATGYWAYRENYETQAALRRVKALQAEIRDLRETISVLEAEWAFLNRPARLRELVELNFPDLQLLEILPEHYADVELVSYPQIKVPEVEISDTVEVNSNGGSE